MVLLLEIELACGVAVTGWMRAEKAKAGMGCFGRLCGGHGAGWQLRVLWFLLAHMAAALAFLIREESRLLASSHKPLRVHSGKALRSTAGRCTSKEAPGCLFCPDQVQDCSVLWLWDSMLDLGLGFGGWLGFGIV